jgi:membrane peptidoglycan carboxypeptidase
MKELGFITNTEYESAKNEVVVFLPKAVSGIRAPHFVFYIKDYLEEKYGAEMVESGGLKVTTTLDYTLQEQAEKVVKDGALQNEKSFGGSNAALVAIDPKTGQILSMVGSRDYFDTAIDGNFNVALAKRQPGSSLNHLFTQLPLTKDSPRKQSCLICQQSFKQPVMPTVKPYQDINKVSVICQTTMTENFVVP